MCSVYISLPIKKGGEYPNGGDENFWMSKIGHKLASDLCDNINSVISPQEMRLPAIIRNSNAGNHDIHLALRSKSSQESGRFKGAHILYFSNSEKGKAYAEIIADEYRKIYPEPNLVSVSSNSVLDELKLTHAPAVMIQTAYHDNPQDEIWLTNNTDEIAHSLSLALRKIFAEDSNA